MQVQARAEPRLALPSQGAMRRWRRRRVAEFAAADAAELRCKVVLVDVWTFGCSNRRNALPQVREWQRKYKDQGLIVVGVHSPEWQIRFVHVGEGDDDESEQVIRQLLDEGKEDNRTS